MKTYDYAWVKCDTWDTHWLDEAGKDGYRVVPGTMRELITSTNQGHVPMMHVLMEREQEK